MFSALIGGSIGEHDRTIYEWARSNDVLSLALFMSLFPMTMLVLFARHKLYAATSVGLSLTFFTIITLGHLDLPELDDVTRVGVPFFLTAVTWFLPLMLLSVAPAKAVTRRLVFLAIGLILLIALNELSNVCNEFDCKKLLG
jgi:hypothetical protein